MKTHGLQTRNKLNKEELNTIKQLAETCNKHENIVLKLNWEMLRKRSGKETNDYLFYDSNGELIGFLGIYQFRSTEVEISGMVHPEHRRKGIFSEMVREVKQECIRRGIPKMIFICQHGSISGKSALESIGAAYSFSEHWMQLEEPSYVVSDGKNVPNIVLRLADSRDNDAIVHLNMAGFDMTEADAREYLKKNKVTPTNQTFIAELQQEVGSLLPVGKINVRHNVGEAFIYGFSVMTDYRGRGYGRFILSETVAIIKTHDDTASIALEVAVDNERALGLYESCGFRVSNANDYYDLASDYKTHNR
jgi:ribosomal protein S18 acetylase RimI-like enzyme